MNRRPPIDAQQVNETLRIAACMQAAGFIMLLPLALFGVWQAPALAGLMLWPWIVALAWRNTL